MRLIFFTWNERGEQAAEQGASQQKTGTTSSKHAVDYVLKNDPVSVRCLGIEPGHVIYLKRENSDAISGVKWQCHDPSDKVEDIASEINQFKGESGDDGATWWPWRTPADSAAKTATKFYLTHKNLYSRHSSFSPTVHQTLCLLN